MSISGGPGGIGGASGIGGVQGAGEIDGARELDGASELDGARATDGTRAVADAKLDQLAAAVDAGQVSPHAALEQLLESSMASNLPEAQRAELRALVTDLAASDPHLRALLAKLG